VQFVKETGHRYICFATLMARADLATTGTIVLHGEREEKNGKGVVRYKEWRKLAYCHLQVDQNYIKFFGYIVKNALVGFRKRKLLFHKNWKFLNLGRREASHGKEDFISCGTEYGGNNLQVGRLKWIFQCGVSTQFCGALERSA